MTKCLFAAPRSEDQDRSCQIESIIEATIGESRSPSQGGLGDADLCAMKRIVLNISSAVASLSSVQLRAIDSIENGPDEFALTLTRMLASGANSHHRDGLAPSPATSSRGSAGREEKMETTPIEKWAGPVAGQTFLETRFRIPRSTLHLWQRRGEVVALRKSARHHVFPLAQFVDSRPVSGLREILSCFLNARLAWLWLVSPASELDGRIPIDMLKEDYVADVVAAARVLAPDLAY